MRSPILRILFYIILGFVWVHMDWSMWSFLSVALTVAILGNLIEAKSRHPYRGGF